MINTSLDIYMMSIIPFSEFVKKNFMKFHIFHETIYEELLYKITIFNLLYFTENAFFDKKS